MKTYDLTTREGNITAIVHTAIPIGIVALAVVYSDRMIGSILLIVGLSLILLWLLPAWSNWVASMWLEREYEYKTNRARTPSIIAGEIELSRVEAQVELTRAISNLSVNQIDYAREMQLVPSIDISTRVTWTVAGTVMPVTFAQYWYDAYSKRPPNQLPGDADFAGLPQRDMCREYNHVIVDTLVKSGLVRKPAGPQPARWLITDKHKQDEALAEIGLWTALDVCSLIMYQEIDDEENHE